MKKILLLIVISFVAATQVVFAENSTPDNCKANGIDFQQATDFMTTLKTVLKSDDKNKLVNMISFPVRVNTITSSGKSVSKEVDKNAFMKQYPKIFTQKTKDAIMSDEGIFCNYQGASSGNGSIWFQTSPKEGSKIFSINVN